MNLLIAVVFLNGGMIRRILLLGALSHLGVCLAQTTITALPAGSAIVGTESIPMDQTGSCAATGGTCKTTPAAILTYTNANAAIAATQITSDTLNAARLPAFSGDVNTSAGSTTTAIGTNIVTNAKLAQMLASSIKCNSTTGLANAADCNPLQVVNLMGAVISVRVVATTNIATLSGLQTIDGIAGIAGTTVLLSAQTGGVNSGIWVQNAGAWTRPANFPTGYSISINCDFVVNVEQGNVFQGARYQLLTTGGAITIGTTAQSWTARNAQLGSPTNAGILYASAAAGILAPASLAVVPPNASQDCMSYADTAGSNGDYGNVQGATGPCIVADVNGHPLVTGNGTGPAVTGTGCSLVAGSQDNSGSITATGTDTCTLAFGSAFTNAPHCAIAGLSTTVATTLTAPPTTAHAIFATALAGTFDYLCF